MRKFIFAFIIAGFTITASILFIGQKDFLAPQVSETNSEIAINQNSPETILKKQKIAEQYGKLPLHFEPNLGQTDEQVQFTARGKGYALFLNGSEATLSLEQKNESKRAVIKMNIEGANDAPKFAGLDETAGKTNYFIGTDPDKWQTNVPNFQKVRYEQVYDGVDVVYYGNNQNLEYDFVLAPNANPDQIKLKFNGVEKAEIEKETGDLLLKTELGTIRQHKPFSYQVVNGDRKEIASLYEISDQDEFIVTFKFAEYDKSKELVIDPILSYGTYLGGTETEDGSGITIDSAGNAYVAGGSSSEDFPTTAGTVKPQLQSSTWSNAFVTKMNPTGTALIYSTYFGGNSASTSARDIEVDDAGNVYITGTTLSSDFPLVNAYQNTFGGTDDAFLAKLNADGSAIVYSTLFGGRNSDFGSKVAVNKATGEATYIGTAYSPDFPTTTGALKERLCNTPTSCNGIFYSGSYIARFSADGTARYVTLFDAKLGDVALDFNENAVVVGTGSESLTTAGAYQTTSTGGVEGYIGKLNPAGNQIIFGTLLGGGLKSDIVTGVALDAAGSIYVTGQTENAAFPTTPGAFDTTYNGSGNLADGFLTKFNAAGTSLIYSTFLGGTGKDEPKAIALGSDDSAFVLGETTNVASFPLRNSIVNAGNIFLTHFNTDASAIVYSTILGSGDGYDIAIDANDNAFVTGRTNNIPTTPNAFQTTLGGGLAVSPDDAFIMKLAPTDENVTTYAISGTVFDANTGFNNNYSAIIATITGTVNRSINLPYSGGQYYFGNLPAGGNYIITVSKVGYEVSPESEVFNNLGANQFANFTILRNREPQSTITSPAYGTNYSAPATITIQADASVPDANDTIQKVEFVAYKDGVNVPIGTDTTAPYEVTWENVPFGTWSLYAYPYDNHGLRGQTQNVVHVFVSEPNGPAVTLTSPTDGQTINAGELFTLSVNASSSVTRVEYYKNGDLFAIRQSPFTHQTTFTEPGNYAITAKAFNSQNQSTTSNTANITIVPFNHTISGKISSSLDMTPIEGITVNMTSTSNPAISGTTTTDANGIYSFTDVFGAGSDGIKIMPVNQNYDFSPVERIFTLGYSNHPNKNFIAVPITGITVGMTSPSGGQSFPPNPTITLAADASSTAGTITKVEFYEYVTGQRIFIASDTEAPYSYDWSNVSGGSHWVFARAYDTDGGIADSASVNFSVATAPSTIRLQGDVTNPSGGWMQGITLRLTGTVNGQPVNKTSVSNNFGAYGFFNLTAGGDYTITPETNGTMTFMPPSATFTNAVADNLDVDFQASEFNQFPTVQINSPTDGATFTMPVSIPVNVTASDPNGDIPYISVSASGDNRSVNIGQSNNGTLDVNWQPTSPGEYTIYASATDNGNLRTTESITITVNPPAPVSVSGRIVDRNSNGIIAASVLLWDYSSQSTEPITTVLTDIDGNYTIPNVVTFQNYKVTVEKLNHTFAPQLRTYFNISTPQTNGDFTGTQQLQPSDFNGDGETDIAVWRPSNGFWYAQHSQSQAFTAVQFGGGSFGDVPVPGNYDGDDKIDVAVFRFGTWYILNSSDGQFRGVQWGAADDIPVPGDYDGDGKTDIAVFRPSNGTWYILNSSDGSFRGFAWGTSTDIPLAGDYDGDGKADITVFRPTDGVWYVFQSSNGSFRAFAFGTNGDIPLVGDFDGDKLTDFTVFRPSEGTWHIWQSATETYRGLTWGYGTDMPVPGDYDRDGKTDIGVFRKSEGNWYVLKSSDNSFAAQTFGQDGDIPVPAAFTR